MSNNLLKPSSTWFLRPRHLKQVIDKNFANSWPQPSEIIATVPPEEEYYIRKYCPITLSHLLPDLKFTKKDAVTDALMEFDCNLRLKFEKHLEETHRLISGSTSQSEESSDTDNASDLGERIENDLSFAIDDKSKKSVKNRFELHLPKVNYPQENMKFLLPIQELNNRWSTSPQLTKNFCTGCINKDMTTPNIPPLHCKYRKRNKNLCLKNKEYVSFPAISNENRVNLNEIKCTDVACCKCENKSLKDCETKCKDIPSPSQVKGNMFSPDIRPGTCRQRSSRRMNYFASANECHQSHLGMHARKSKSSSPIRQHRSRSSSPVEEGFDCLFPPSPYMLELARLRREKLKIEERLLLKRRRLLEMERLRSPVDGWYTMKDKNFHEEARRNNMYLKNEKIIPFIQERKRLLSETIKL